MRRFAQIATPSVGAAAFSATAIDLANKGKVVAWTRGFGFIEDDAQKQHFVHNTALKVEADGFRALSVGQEVEFDIAEDNGKTRAENVTAVGGGLLPPGERPADFGGRGRGRGGDFGRGRGRGDFRGRGRGGDFGGERRERRDYGERRERRDDMSDF